MLFIIRGCAENNNGEDYKNPVKMRGKLVNAGKMSGFMKKASMQKLHGSF